MPARQLVSFQVPFVPEVQRVLLANGTQRGAFLLSMTSLQDALPPHTLFSAPIAWNSTAGALERALSSLEEDTSVTRVGSLYEM